MFDLKPTSVSATSETYALLAEQLRSMFEGERDFIANAANLSSLVYHTLAEVNWVGFYIRRGEELVLGPFQGKPACVRIPLGKGVCGTAAKELRTVLVEDVDTFLGHIACDSASRSEIVVPLVKDGAQIGVLDLDSPVLSRFGVADRAGLEEIVRIFLDASDVPDR